MQREVKHALGEESVVIVSLFAADILRSPTGDFSEGY
jgi:hypothetical protein